MSHMYIQFVMLYVHETAVIKKRGASWLFLIWNKICPFCETCSSLEFDWAWNSEPDSTRAGQAVAGLRRAPPRSSRRHTARRLEASIEIEKRTACRMVLTGPQYARFWWFCRAAMMQHASVWWFCLREHHMPPEFQGSSFRERILPVVFFAPGSPIPCFAGGGPNGQKTGDQTLGCPGLKRVQSGPVQITRKVVNMTSPTKSNLGKPPKCSIM